jgi:putative transposase
VLSGDSASSASSASCPHLVRILSASCPHLVRILSASCWCCHQQADNGVPHLVGVVTNKQIMSYFSTMPQINFDHHAQFFTATILEWKHLLKEDAYKDIIIKSLLFLKNEGSIVVYAFVIMPNHIHIVWQIQDGYTQDKIQLRFLKFTAQQMKFKLKDTSDTRLSNFLVNAKDRQYQFWERNPYTVDLWSPGVITQKIDYIHNNPLQDKWQLVKYSEDYKYSSAKFYENGIDEFGLLTHYMG